MLEASGVMERVGRVLYRIFANSSGQTLDVSGYPSHHVIMSLQDYQF